jgi:hypothetical protein
MRILASMALALILGIASGCENQAPPSAPVKQPEQPASAPQFAPKPAETIRQKADVGMGEKGRGYGDGPVATPIKTLWAVKEQIVLLQIQDALRTYKALDPQGHGPQNDKEFMEKIITANSIRLPALPSGHRYVYDPAKEELMVEQPKQP